jgi:hypothetical protein
MKLEPSSGRLPTESEFADPINAPFAVVSERMAQALWAGESAIGKVLVSERGDRESVVIGVVPDAKYVRLDAEAYGQVYWPYGPWGRSASVLIQSRGVIRQTLREAVTRARVVPGVGVVRAVTGEEALGDSIRLRAFRAWVFGGFAAAALGVAAVGLFGLTAMSTAWRRREMGLRRALGASRAAVVASLVKEHMPALAAGLLFGGLAASWAVQFVRPSLYQFTGQDVRLWGFAAVVVLLAAGSGVLLPALKASRADPMTALRVD